MKMFWVVLKKELLDCFRDKRSIVMMILPLLIFPLLLTFYNEHIESADESLAEQLILATNDEAGIEEVTDFLTFNDIKVEIVKTDDAPTDLKSGKISLILNKDENGYHIIYDQNSIKSTKAVNIIGSAIEANKTAQIYAVLNLYGESAEFLSDYNYTFEDVSVSSKDGGNSLIAVLGPMLIVMFIATGGAGIALDMFCGEKERGSLEGILATQINRKPLYLAKTITVFIFVCFSTLVSVGGYLISFALNDEIMGTSTKEMGLPAIQALLLSLVTGIFAFFTAAIISMISLSAKSVKEGSLRINLFTLIPTVIAGASMYMQPGNVSVAINFIPVINVINILKAIFINAQNTIHLLITVLSTVFYGIIFLVMGYWLLNSEKVVQR